MAKYSIKWSASVDGENIIEANSEEEARKKWYDTPLDTDDITPDNFEIQDVNEVE